MALPAPKNNYEKLIKDLFKRYAIPFNRPEYQELITEGENASKFYQKSPVMDKHFESRVLTLAEAIRAEEVEAIHKKKAQERSLQIASERSLAPVKLNNSQVLMAYPWFSPDQKERKEVFEYRSSDGTTSLTVIPSTLCGAAKVWDGDILMYALSKAVKAYLETKEFPKQVEFSAYEYLRQGGKNTSGKNIENFKMSLNRLTLTQYISRLIDPVSGKEKGGETFKLCEYEWKNDTSGGLQGVIIHFSDKLFKYFATKNDLLTLKQGHLLEAWKEDRSGLRKRLLMLVNTRLGNQPLWKITLLRLKETCGYDRELKYFKRDFQKLIPSLPWLVDIEKSKKGSDLVTFVPDEQKEQETISTN